MTFASNGSVKTMRCIRPRVLTADIAFARASSARAAAR